MSTPLFLELLQVALGTRTTLSRVPSVGEWQDLYAEARKHCVVGVCIQALQLEDGQWGNRHGIPIELKLRWIGKGEEIADANRTMNQQCKKLSDKLTRSGYWNCILKGQGIALLYPYPLWREPGDIDIWIGGGRRRIVEMTRRVTHRCSEVTYHHTDFHVFPHTHVEAHFTPTWMFNPLYNRRLQRWLGENAELLPNTPFPVPATHFNVLYLLLHIYRHIFDEGIGLRQIIDYYYTLRNYHNIAHEHGDLSGIFEQLGLWRFASGLMWVMHQTLALPQEWMIAPPNKRTGQWLLTQILMGGNFGHHASHHPTRPHQNRLQRFGWRARLAVTRLAYFPGEAIWEMPWRIWHYFWRLKNGYL